MENDNFRIRYKTLRNVSSYFIGRADVREQIFEERAERVTCAVQRKICRSIM